ncbi:transcriptional pleiotropic repressor [Desulfitispora alkaliphila]|uniref:GTP-sensing pleiotropic transcriptional regulator CodY n=1 Tax=Desulfitispora alkaliphila TaxID=622674 RepID=UPI003D247848
MKSLLKKLGNINKLIQNPSGDKISYSEMAKVLSDNIQANCYIIGNTGKILGFAFMEDFGCSQMEEIVTEQQFPESYYSELGQFDETKVNLKRPENDCVFTMNEACIFAQKVTTVVPITGGGRRLGTLILAKFNVDFTDEDVILAEYGSTVVGMEMFRKHADQIEEEARQRATVHIALGALSYTEQEAAEHIFDAVEGEEGVLVASKIADSANIARSVIVNSLRKIESAGVIEVRSLGMKGTFIRILNPFLKDELKKLRR